MSLHSSCVTRPHRASLVSLCDGGGRRRNSRKPLAFWRTIHVMGEPLQILSPFRE